MQQELTVVLRRVALATMFLMMIVVVQGCGSEEPQQSGQRVLRVDEVAAAFAGAKLDIESVPVPQDTELIGLYSSFLQPQAFEVAIFRDAASAERASQLTGSGVVREDRAVGTAWRLNNVTVAAFAATSDDTISAIDSAMHAME